MRETSRFVLTCAVVLSLALSACSGGGGGDSGGSTATTQATAANAQASPTATAQSPEAVAAARATALEDLLAASDALAFDLYRAASGNAAVAPHVIFDAVVKLYAGAKGTTADELAAAAGFPESRDGLLQALGDLDQDFADRLAGAGGVLKPTSSFKLQSRYGFLQTYLTTLADSFGLEPTFYDFFAGHSDVRLSMWDDFNLDASWATPFDPALTSLEWFALVEPGKVKQVKMVKRSGTFPAFHGDGYLAVELPFARGDLGLLVVLPDEGRFSEVEAAIGAAKWKEIAAGLAPETLDFVLPKFSVGTDMAATLKPRGLTAALTADQADFSGVDGTRDLYLSSLSGSASFSSDEAGAKGYSRLVGPDRRPPGDVDGSVGARVQRIWLYFDPFD